MTAPESTGPADSSEPYGGSGSAGQTASLLPGVATGLQTNSYAPWRVDLNRVLLCRPAVAFRSQRAIAAEWRELGFTEEPDLSRARSEYAQFVALLEARGIQAEFVESVPGISLDALYPRDAAVITPNGAVLCRMGKPPRSGEPEAVGAALDRLGITVLGRIPAPGKLEGGDLVWLDERTVAVGEGYRSNRAGIQALSEILGDSVRVLPVSLPHWNGPSDVLHLMSLLSPLDEDLLATHSRLLPVTFINELRKLEKDLVEVEQSEYPTLACNILATGDRICIMPAGNRVTERLLRDAGLQVQTFSAREICLKGQGGPTCMTLPIGWR